MIGYYQGIAEPIKVSGREQAGESETQKKDDCEKCRKFAYRCSGRSHDCWNQSVDNMEVWFRNT